MYYVSVIIPLYNAEKYITGCVDSLLAQTLKQVEIIIVNDCSTDNGMKLCQEKYGDRDNVVLIDQPTNMGPAAARNAGIRVARGEYITFADSDDALRSNALMDMYISAKAMNSDVLHCMGVVYPLVDDPMADLMSLGEDDYFKVRADVNREISTRTALEYDLKKRLDGWFEFKYMWNIWNKLFKKSFLLEHELFFEDMRLAEDQLFCFACLMLAKNYTIYPGNYYMYRLNNESLSRGARNLSLLERGLRSQLQTVDAMKKITSSVPWLQENPHEAEKVLRFVLDGLESSFVSVCYQQLGREAVEESGIVHKLFEEYYGEDASFMEYLFYQSHDRLPKDTDLRNQYTSVKYWSDMKKMTYEKYPHEELVSPLQTHKKVKPGEFIIFLEQMEKDRANHPLYQVTLDKPVDGSILRQAVDKACKVHEWLTYGILVEEDWSYYIAKQYVYYVENDAPITVKQASQPICPGAETSAYHGVAISYEDKTIQFCYRHTLTDGKGMLVATETIMYYYFALLYGEREANGVYLLENRDTMKVDYETPRKKYNLIDVDYDVCRHFHKSLNLRPEYGISAETVGCFAELAVPSAQLVDFSKQKKTSVAIATYLLIAEMFQRLHPENQDQVSCHMMADTRKIFDVEDTMQNCVAEIRIGVDGPKLDDAHFEENAAVVHEMFVDQMNEVSIINNGVFAWKHSDPFTFMLSYVGRTHLGCYADEMKKLAIREGGVYKVDMYDCNGTMYINFLFQDKSKMLANKLVDLMQEYGMQARMEEVGILPAEIQ